MIFKQTLIFLSLVSAAIFNCSCSCSSNHNNPEDSGTEESDPEPAFRTQQLKTAQDILNSSSSNISIINATGSEISVSGLFIASFDVNDCSACSGGVVGGNNAAAIADPVTFAAGESITIGQNYLYNLIYSGLNYVRMTASSAPCNLPGCSWPDDSTSVTGWCLSIGVMSRHSDYTYSNYVTASYPAANIPPYGDAVSSDPFDYNFDLIDPMTLGAGETCFGPIVCDDETMTCSASTAQSKSFSAY